eukprot:g10143.t1
MAMAMALSGGLGIIHRHMPIKEQATKVQRVKQYNSGFILNPACLAPRHTVEMAQKLQAELGCSGIPLTENGPGTRPGGAFVVLRRAEDMPRLVKQFWGRDLPRRGIGIPFKIHPAKAQPMDPVPLEEWSLVGDFNGWNEHATPMARDAFGTWEVTLPPGSIAHRSKVKFCAVTPDGAKVYRVPAWITWSCCDLGKFGSTYDGIYWDPATQPDAPDAQPGAAPDAPGAPDVYFRGFKAKAPTVQSLRIYEAHVGMSSVEPKCNSYLEFARDVLPRIKEAGYNCVQLMAIMEHSYYGSFGRSDDAGGRGPPVTEDLVHSHVSNNADDGLNGMDFGQAECDSYFMTGDRGYHRLWDSRLYCYKNYEVLRYLAAMRRQLELCQLQSFHCQVKGRESGVGSFLEEYFGLQTDVDAVVYLMLASELVKSVKPSAIMIAEDVSGMPGLCVPVAEGARDAVAQRDVARSVAARGVGFDYRLAMSLPDLWISLLKEAKDEHWGMNHIVSKMCNRRRGVEKTVAYAECHDQSIVGDKTIAFWLMDAEMPGFAEASNILWGCSWTPLQCFMGAIVLCFMRLPEEVIIRAITMGLGGEAYLNFMGNEFGHPEWVDFPREGNNWSAAHCRRRFDLADSGLLRYRFLLKWDVALHALEESTGFASDEHLLVSSQHEMAAQHEYMRQLLIGFLNAMT